MSLTDLAVWALWSGLDEDRHIHAVYPTRDAACAALCDIVLMERAQLIAPGIERLEVQGSGAPLSSATDDRIAKVIRAYRGLASAGKTDMDRASLRPLKAALDALAFPMAVRTDVPADANPFHGS